MNPWWVLWALAVAVVLVWQVRRAVRGLPDCDRIIADTLASPQPLTGTADEDECELIWDLPAYDPDLNDGCDRLRQAIREHREEDS